ncbi:MAG: DUF1648 domain-containing protein [Crocinitomicaceae bacterium]|nr:DUF1648 domain-containing protein [Crocinitomicaceae bacterium]
MYNQPKIKVPLTLMDKLLEMAIIVALITLWIVLITNYSSLPDTIPVHYTIKGEVDGYGSKSTLIVLQIVSTVMTIGLTLLNRFPHIFNYPFQITEQNAVVQYRLATRFMRFLTLILVLIFGISPLEISYSSSMDSFSAYWLVVILGAIFIPLGIYFYLAWKNK